MSQAVSFKPEEYHTATPYLIVDGAARAIEFYQEVFGAVERMRMPGPGGKVMHAEIRIGDSMIMLADEFPEMDARGPKAWGGSPVFVSLYLEDVDAVVAKATTAGATLSRPVQTQFYGDRSGMIIDPFGHKWNIATHVEDVAPEEMQRRMAAAGEK